MDDTEAIIDALRKRFPNIQGPKKNDICYATQNRQDAVKELAQQCNLVLVVGSPNSSNSNRLREIAEKFGAEAHLIDGANDIDKAWLKDDVKLGVTAGGAAPEVLVEEVLEKLKAYGVASVRSLSGREENVVFSLPVDLRKEQNKS